jgi:DNA-binding NtrC family response regulator
MAGYRVLLVDDEEEYTRTMTERMEVRGIKLHVANSGEEAIEKVKQKNYDAILLDLAMPGLDGIETLKQLRKIDSDLQIIMLTGQATVQKSVNAMKHGASDLMEKPVDLQDLLSKIEEASSKKALLVEKHMEDHLSDIMRKKGW